MIAFRSACAILGVTIAAGVATSVTRADEMPPVPNSPCNLGHRMNVEIVDGWMFECRCWVLAHGFHCEWDLVGQVASPAVRKFKRQHRRLIPVLYIKPAVTG